MYRQSLITAAALAASLLAAAPVLAQPFPRQTVSYGDLDLNTHAGARTMLTRIDEAARHVCEDDNRLISISERRMIRLCIEETTRNTIAKLNHPTVTALYQARSPDLVVAGR